ncbi:MAG: capsule assembly Wzi family protein [Bacteroidia bacterium]|nr:capsule assembly Wzi family protein [Bacteroidia bacterium]
MDRILLILFLCPSFIFAQDTDILLNHDLYHFIDRIDIKGLADTTIHTDLKPYGRNSLSAVLKKVDSNSLSAVEKGWFERIQSLGDDDHASQQDSKGILKYFYRNRRDLFQVNEDQLQLFINPVLYTHGGLDRNTFLNAEGENLPIYTNARGVQIRGSASGKVGFHTEVYDNYNRIPQFIYNRYQQNLRLPGEGFIKTFDRPNGLDYFSSRAYLTFSPVKNIRVKFGKDRVFWGNGHQSLLLSDHAADPLMLNITTRIWKLEYVNQFTQMVDFLINRNDNEGTLPRKYGAFHMLNYKPNDKISIGIFESVIYAPYLANGYRGFELQYLNPIIFYRAIEQFIGSPDNALLGAHVKWNFLNHFQSYGQIMVDDYNYGVRNQGTGYWGNKIGWQLGAKYIDAFNIPTLDLQFETNRIRPYTYQHFNIASNYTSYGQSLGHGAGANLQDFYAALRYRPWPSVFVMLSYTYRMEGRDFDQFGTVNYGGNLDRATGNRPEWTIQNSDFGHTVGQGNTWTVQQLYGRVSWQIGLSDVYLDLEGRYRSENTLRSYSINGGLRANIAPASIKY